MRRRQKSESENAGGAPKGRICKWCLREFKASRLGKAFRKSNGGTWRGIKWPHHLYVENLSGHGLCQSHQSKHRAHLQSIFDRRDRCLARIGYPSYRAYLLGDLWKEIRAKCFEAFGDDCHFCGDPGKHVHHDNYDRDVIYGQRFDALYVVCTRCHQRGTFLKNKELRSPKSTTRRMHELACSEGMRKHVRAKYKERRKIKIEPLPEPQPNPAGPSPEMVDYEKRKRRLAKIVRKNRRRAARATRQGAGNGKR